MTPTPVVLIGESYWGGLYQWLQQQTATAGYIDSADMDWLHLVDDCDVAADILLRHYHKLGVGATGVGSTGVGATGARN